MNVSKNNTLPYLYSNFKNSNLKKIEIIGSKESLETILTVEIDKKTKEKNFQYFLLSGYGLLYSLFFYSTVPVVQYNTEFRHFAAISYVTLSVVARFLFIKHINKKKELEELQKTYISFLERIKRYNNPILL